MRSHGAPRALPLPPARSRHLLRASDAPPLRSDAQAARTMQLSVLLCFAALLARSSAQPTDSLFSPSPAIWSGAGYKWGTNTSALRASSSGTNPANGLPLSRNGAWRTGDTFVNYGFGFTSGVASGDPLPGRIILWTRWQPAGDQSAWAAADPENTQYTYNYNPAAGYVSTPVAWWLGPNATGTRCAQAYTRACTRARLAFSQLSFHCVVRMRAARTRLPAAVTGRSSLTCSTATARPARACTTASA